MYREHSIKLKEYIGCLPCVGIAYDRPPSNVIDEVSFVALAEIEILRHIQGKEHRGGSQSSPYHIAHSISEDIHDETISIYLLVLSSCMIVKSYLQFHFFSIHATGSPKSSP